MDGLTYRHLDKGVYWKVILSYFLTKTNVVGTQKNRLNQTVFEHTKHMLN